MPEMTGFEVVKQLHTCGARPFIVFVTAFDQFAIKAIKAGAFDYLLKPVEEDELLSVIGRIHMERGVPDMSFRLHQIEKVINNQRKIIFSTRSGYFMLRPEEILYIEASSNYSEVHLVVPRREVVSMNLGAVQEVLPSQFIRISRSVIINSDYLVKVSGANKRCVLKAGTEEIEFSIPEKQLPELRKALENL